MALSLMTATSYSMAALVSLQPMTKENEQIMQERSSNLTLMISICKEDSNLDLLKSLAKTNTKATIFVSGDALEKDNRLAIVLNSRKDIFEVESLGQHCSSKQSEFEEIKKNISSRTNQKTEELRNQANMLAENVIKGSASIFKATGSKPTFFAYGLDFDSIKTDVFVISRLEEGLSQTLKNPNVIESFNMFANSKAVFSNWVVMGKLDRGASEKSWDPEKLTVALKQVKRSEKAAQSWLPFKRASNLNEMQHIGN